MRTAAAALACLVLLAPGCISSAAKDQAAKSAMAHDTYASLIESTLDGSVAEKDGKPVTKEDLVSTPESVKELLQNVITAVYVSRKGWHQLHFAVGDGPDPSSLDLDEIPKIE